MLLELPPVSYEQRVISSVSVSAPLQDELLETCVFTSPQAYNRDCLLIFHTHNCNLQAPSIRCGVSGKQNTDLKSQRAQRHLLAPPFDSSSTAIWIFTSSIMFFEYNAAVSRQPFNRRSPCCGRCLRCWNILEEKHWIPSSCSEVL